MLAGILFDCLVPSISSRSSGGGQSSLKPVKLLPWRPERRKEREREKTTTTTPGEEGGGKGRRKEKRRDRRDRDDDANEAQGMSFAWNLGAVEVVVVVQILSQLRWLSLFLFFNYCSWLTIIFYRPSMSSVTISFWIPGLNKLSSSPLTTIGLTLATAKSICPYTSRWQTGICGGEQKESHRCARSASVLFCSSKQSHQKRQTEGRTCLWWHLKASSWKRRERRSLFWSLDQVFGEKQKKRKRDERTSQPSQERSVSQNICEGRKRKRESSSRGAKSWIRVGLKAEKKEEENVGAGRVNFQVHLCNLV